MNKTLITVVTICLSLCAYNLYAAYEAKPFKTQIGGGFKRQKVLFIKINTAMKEDVMVELLGLGRDDESKKKTKKKKSSIKYVKKEKTENEDGEKTDVKKEEIVDPEEAAAKAESVLQPLDDYLYQGWTVTGITPLNNGSDSKTLVVAVTIFKAFKVTR